MLILHKKCPALLSLDLSGHWNLSDRLLKNLCSFPDGADGPQVLPNLTALDVSCFDIKFTIKGVQDFLAKRRHLERFRDLKIIPRYIYDSSDWVPLVIDVIKA